MPPDRPCTPADAAYYRKRAAFYLRMRDEAARAGDPLSALVFADRWKHHKAEARAAERCAGRSAAGSGNS